MSTQFYTSLGPGEDKDHASTTCFYDDKRHPNATASVICGLRQLDFISGFGLANIFFSFLAYLLVTTEDPGDGGSKLTRAVRDIIARFTYRFMKNQSSQPNKGTADTANYDGRLRTSRKDTNSRSRRSSEKSSSPMHRNESPAHAGQGLNLHNGDSHTRSGTPSAHSCQGEQDRSPEYKTSPIYRGRRFLLLTFFAAGVLTVFFAAMMFRIHGSCATIFIFIMFTAFYAPVSKAMVVANCPKKRPGLIRESMIRALELYHSYLV